MPSFDCGFHTPVYLRIAMSAFPFEIVPALHNLT